MCGSGTLNVEASLIGVDSIGIEKSPFCVLMSQVKYEALKISKRLLPKILDGINSSYRALTKSKKLPDNFGFKNGFNPEKAITLLAFLDSMGYARRCSKDINHLFPSVLKRYVGQINSSVLSREKLKLKLGQANFEVGDARSLPLDNNPIDAIITSPPYSFAGVS
jgi:hypothetical protein